MSFAWEKLEEGGEYIFGFFQMDISKSSELPEPEALQQKTKANVRQFVTAILEGVYGARLLAWPGDGGSFLFPLLAGFDHDNMVTAALHVQKEIEIFNSLPSHNLLFPHRLAVRISCHEGRAYYAQNPSDMHGKSINYFLKYERDIGQVNSVTVTKEVLDHLKSKDQKKLFSLQSRYDCTMGGEPYSRELYRTVPKEPGAERGRLAELNQQEMGGQRIKVLIVEDEGLMRDMLRVSLSAYSNLEVVGAVGDGESAVRAAEELGPDVMLMDIELGDGPSGIEAGHRIRALQPRIGIVILSFHHEKQYIAGLPAERASGWSYLLKQSVTDTAALTRAIEGSAAGFVVLDPAIVEGLRPAANSSLERLTVRQCEVLELMAQGYSNAAIGERLTISQKSVENHINTIFQELGVSREDPVHPRVKAVLSYLQQTHSR